MSARTISPRHAALREDFPGEPTTRRYPRTLGDAFRFDPAYCNAIEVYRPNTVIGCIRALVAVAVKPVVKQARWWLLMRRAEKQFPGMAPKGPPEF